MTIYLRSILAGVLAVLVAAVAVVGMFALLASTMGGEVRAGASLSWKSGATAAMIFALGFVWQFRRASKPARDVKAGKNTTGSASARRG